MVPKGFVSETESVNKLNLLWDLLAEPGLGILSSVYISLIEAKW